MDPDHPFAVDIPSKAVWLELDVQQVMWWIQNSYLRDKEDVIFMSVIEWIKHDLEKRKPFIVMLMKEVRFVSLPIEFLELIVEKESLVVLEPSLSKLRETGIQYRRSEAPARAQLRRSLWQTCNYVRPRMMCVKTQLMYIVGGKPTEAATISIQSVESFDFQKGTWSQVTETPQQRWNPAIAQYDGKIWVVGGFDRSAPLGRRVLDTVRLYDPSRNEWSDGPKLRESRYGSCLVEFNGKLLALGGKRTSAAIKSNEVYNASVKAWRHHSYMKHERYQFNAAVLRSRLYVFGGEKASVDPQMEFFCWESCQWTLLTEIIPRRQNFDIAVLDELLYVVGGDANMTFCVFNPATDRWTTIPRPQDKCLSEIAVVARDRCLYMVGGAGKTGVTSFFWCYDPEKDEWFSMPNCIEARCGAKLLMIDL